jgi:hypothetical protein
LVDFMLELRRRWLLEFGRNGDKGRRQQKTSHIDKIFELDMAHLRVRPNDIRYPLLCGLIDELFDCFLSNGDCA